MAHQVILPEGWPRPRGYSNGILADGKFLYVAGMVGWDTEGKFPGPNFHAQMDQALANVMAVVKAAGGEASHLTRLTIYVVDKRHYLADLKQVGALYRKHLGVHYPAMALVQVVALVEDEALIEIEATAVL